MSGISSKDLYIVAFLILKNSTLSDTYNVILDAIKYGYDDKGHLIFDCSTCNLPEKIKIQNKCNHLPISEVVERPWNICPGYGVNHESAPEIFELIQYVDGLKAIDLENMPAVFYNMWRWQQSRAREANLRALSGE